MELYKTSVKGTDPFIHINNPLAGTDPTGYLPCKDGIKDDCNPKPKKKERRRKRASAGVWGVIQVYNGDDRKVRTYSSSSDNDTSSINNQSKNINEENFTHSYWNNETLNRNGIFLGDNKYSFGEAMFAMSALSHLVSISEHSLATPYISWLGKNGKWNRGGWGGNKYAGSRTAAIRAGNYVNATQELFDSASRKLFILGVAFSAVDTVRSLQDPNESTLKVFSKSSLDVAAGYVGTFGGGYGALIAGGYFTVDFAGQEIGGALGTGAAATVYHSRRFFKELNRLNQTIEKYKPPAGLFFGCHPSIIEEC